MLVKIDKIEVRLDFHVYPIIDFELLIGSLLENLLQEKSSQGSLSYESRETAFTPPITYLENPLAKPFPIQNPLEMMVQTSSSTIKFEPHPTSPHCVVPDHDRDTTMIFHDEPLAIENRWAREFSEALSLEYEEKDSIEEHGSFILETLPPCSFSTPPESVPHWMP